MDESSIAQAAKALAEPAKIAIEKLSAGLGKLHEPINIRRIERAKADACYIKQAGKQDIKELKAAYEQRETYRKARRELTLQLIADKASARLFEDPGPNPAPPEDDWVEEFSVNAQDAASEPLREMWSRIYAGEVKAPGTVPRRMLRLAKDLDQRAAKLFHTLCGCSILGRARILFLIEDWEEATGLTHFNLKELEELRIIEVPTMNNGARFNGKGGVGFFEQFVHFHDSPQSAKNVNYAPFTKFGEALFDVSDPIPNDAYFAAFLNALKKSEWNFTVEPRKRKD